MAPRPVCQCVCVCVCVLLLLLAVMKCGFGTVPGDGVSTDVCDCVTDLLVKPPMASM